MARWLFPNFPFWNFVLLIRKRFDVKMSNYKNTALCLSPLSPSLPLSLSLFKKIVRTNAQEIQTRHEIQSE